MLPAEYLFRGALARTLRADASGIVEAAHIIANGGLVAYPTDTVYGLGCNPFNETALWRLLDVKGGRQKPLPVLVQSLNRAEELAEFNDLAKRIATSFWPGALTLVAPLKRKVPERLTAGEATIGLRMPKHEVTLDLLAHVNGFLVGTSANLTGQPACTSHKQVLHVFGHRVDAVVEGRSGLTQGSTVLEVRGREYVILREGPIGQSMIEAALRR